MSCSMATRPGALLLAPGAGSSSTHPTSVAIEALVSPLPVVRMDFPYRKAGRRAPDRAPVLVAAVRDEAAALVAAARVRADRLVLGGRSMGGRMCSMAVAEGLPAAGLVLLSYPLHPPGKPDQLRVDHLPAITAPTLVVSGTSDPFGRPDDLRRHLDTIDAPVTYVWVEGAGHEWKGRDRQVAEVVAAWLKGRPLPERLERAARRAPGPRG
jgi:predicted alpha/beta-hydrolase family hydrolase